jgi:hypothetical protein
LSPTKEAVSIKQKTKPNTNRRLTQENCPLEEKTETNPKTRYKNKNGKRLSPNDGISRFVSISETLFLSTPSVNANITIVERYLLLELDRKKLTKLFENIDTQIIKKGKVAYTK